MTVRWKPLLILSGLFLVIAVVGVVAIAWSLVPRSAADILPMARAEWKAGQYEKAKIHFLRALQKDNKNAAIHEEMASMFAEWAERAPSDKRAEIRGWQLSSLINAARFDRKAKGPRRLLLADARRRDVSPDVVYWAKEVLGLEPNHADAHDALAVEGLEERGPNLPEIRRHLAALEAAKAPKVRIAWIKARLAQASGDDDARDEALASARGLALPADADPTDRMALVRLRALDVQTATRPETLADRVRALQAEVKALLSGQAPAPERLNRLSLLLERTQRSLIPFANQAEAPQKDAIDALVEAIEGDVETIFQKAVATDQPDLKTFLTYADHLRSRQKRQRCLEVVDQALKSPMASRPAAAEVAMGLHAVAIESLLANLQDASRFDKAAPHIKTLLGSTLPRYQGLGHLFQGAIDLEKSGVSPVTVRGDGDPGASPPSLQSKLRASALAHLKIAAAQLPDIAEAQARYGVALVLAQEQGLGRQYLQNAMRLGNLDPQYQVWAAWSMVQAGYPEEAEPIVTQLLAQVAQGQQPRDLEGTLHLINGEINQARRTPEHLKVAIAEYKKSIAAGQIPTPAVQLRLAQLEIQLSQPDAALKRIDALRDVGLGGPAAEHLAILTLFEQGKKDEARAVLEKARQKFPDNDDLAGLDAAMYAQADQPQEANRVLDEFLTAHPDHVNVALMRAQVLSEMLGDPKEARKILANLADHSDHSAPLVQLALLDLKQHDQEAVANTIAKIRSRWKEAAVADLLDGQLAIEQGNLSAAIDHFDEALKKDPTNKLVQFWKAQLDSRNGSTNEAARAFEEIAREKPVKELEGGLSLATAAESSLASLALESGDFDTAIRKFEDLRGQNGLSRLGRQDRWQLVTAYAAKGNWAAAKNEMAALLNDPRHKPTTDERVRAANLYRVHREDKASLDQLDYVLKVNPAHPAAVVTRAYVLASMEKNAEATEVLRTAIAASTKEPPSPVFFLMLAAIDHVTPPASDAPRRALATLERGLQAQPDAVDLARAKYRLLRNGDAKAAVAFVESKAKPDPRGHFRRLLVEVYRDQQNYEGAERILRELMTLSPRDALVAQNLVRLTAIQAIEAARRGDRDRERALNEKTAGLIREFRSKFPNDLSFLQSDCDLASRRGDMARALAITQEMDRVAKASPLGPMLRAQLFAAQGRTREAADAYTEVLERSPRQLDARVQLGLARLKLGEADEALRQAEMVLEADGSRRDAVLLRVRAMAAQAGTEGQVSAHRDRAIRALDVALEKQPAFPEAYHLKSELLLEQRRRDDAIAALKAGLKAVPDDGAGLALLIQRLAERRDGDQKPSDPDPSDARAVADEFGGPDQKGPLMLAIAVGYHKAGRYELARPWAEKAVAKLDTPMVHLNYGDLLLALGEHANDPAEAKQVFRQAVAQYDLVLKAQANSVEAINNKAWILHNYLGQGREALELARGLVARVDPATLPGEFFDTLGAIQEALGKTRDAEDSYLQGLRRAPDNPALNYHMGKLLQADRNRKAKAGGFLEKALAGRDRLSPAMASDLATLMHKVSGN